MTTTDPALRALDVDRIVTRWDNGEFDNWHLYLELAALAAAAEAAPLDVQRLLDAMTEFYADFDEAGVGRKRSWRPEAVGIAVIYERLTEYAALAATSREASDV